MQASLETCTRCVLIISFFLQSNESNFFSSDCEKAAQHLSLAWLLFLGRSWMNGRALFLYSSLYSRSAARQPGPCCYRLLFLRWLWAMRAARENNKSADAAAATTPFDRRLETGTFFSPQYFASARCGIGKIMMLSRPGLNFHAPPVFHFFRNNSQLSTCSTIAANAHCLFCVWLNIQESK